MSDYFVIGVTGQDGSLLARELLRRGHSVTGTYRSFVATSFWRLEQMGIHRQVNFLQYDIGSPLGLQMALLGSEPRAIFFTAGDSSTASSGANPARLIATNAGGAAEQIEILRKVAPKTPAVFFSSSEVFGYQTRPGVVRNESSRRRPSNPYGVSKLAVGSLVDFYVREEGMNLFEAVLFPHESPYRGSNFLVKKVVRALCQQSLGRSDAGVEEFGSLEPTRDWGSAEQYMRWLINLVEVGEPGSYVIGTGKNHSVWDVFRTTGEILGLRLEKRSAEHGLSIVDGDSQSVFAHAEARVLGNSGHGAVASSAKIHSAVSVDRPVSFESTLREMIEAELHRLGERLKTEDR